MKYIGDIYYTLDFPIAGNCQKELVLQGLPIAQSLSNTDQLVADTETKGTQSETNEVILEIEVSAEHSLLANIAFTQKFILDFKILTF